MKRSIMVLFLLSSCSILPPKPSNELEKISDDVLKHKEGIEIEIKPLKKQ